AAGRVGGRFGGAVGPRPRRLGRTGGGRDRAGHGGGRPGPPGQRSAGARRRCPGAHGVRGDMRGRGDGDRSARGALRVGQFEQRYGPAIAEGSLTLTFRRWVRTQVVAGRRYRTAAGMVEVEAVDVVSPSDVTDADAAAAGYPSAAALVADLREPADRPLYRVRFHGVGGPDPRDELA